MYRSVNILHSPLLIFLCLYGHCKIGKFHQKLLRGKHKVSCYTNQFKESLRLIYNYNCYSITTNNLC